MLCHGPKKKLRRVSRFEDILLRDIRQQNEHQVTSAVDSAAINVTAPALVYK